MTAILVIDTNLLCLLIVGRVGEDQIQRHKRLAAYTVRDYYTLGRLVANFNVVSVCPQVLAECSNLIRQTSEPLRTYAGQSLRDFVEAVEELYVPAREAMALGEYNRLGVTDAVLLQMTLADRLLITDDLDLYLAARRRGAVAINYNHIREGSTLRSLGIL